MVRHNIERGKMELKTAHGTLIAYANDNPDYPSFYIDFQPDGAENTIPIAMVEDAPTRSKSSETPDDALAVRVWGDPWTDEYTYRKDIPIKEIVEALESEA